MKIWVSGLIPAAGAEFYDGVRLVAAVSEDACYRDIWFWLGEHVGALVGQRAGTAFPGVRQTKAALSDAMDAGVLRAWNVEEQEIP